MDAIPPGSELPSIRLFAADCRALPPEAFAARHAGAFLLLRGRPGGLQRPGDHPQWTLAGVPLAELAAETSRQSELDQVALPVRHRKPDSKKSLITLGRAESSDVCVPDLSVSVYHAFFLPRPDGGFVLQDAGSKNGTFVDDRRVPAQGKGPPAELASGCDLRFGGVGFQFLVAAQFQRLVRLVLG
jgi:hypothetical protein